MEALECPDGNGLALEAAKTAECCMRYGWKKVRGGSFTRCDAPGPPPWFDETGEKRKRVAKGKGLEQERLRVTSVAVVALMHSPESLAHCSRAIWSKCGMMGNAARCSTVWCSNSVSSHVSYFEYCTILKTPTDFFPDFRYF